ncbi:MAG: hypothetical protein NTZ59_09900 [Bacteroidetes bacterium]|jgi:hypothetical protein|nr:hypothetical protein [Bacteroidota bacterium]
MEFFDTAFTYLAPILVLLSLFLKGKKRYYALNALAIVNILLIFNSVFIIRQLYAFVKMAMEMNVKPDPNAKIEIGWQDVKNWLIILVPFLFLIKPIMGNRILSLLMLFLFLNNWLVYVFDCVKGKSNFYFSSFTTYHLPFQMMHYFSWFVFLYAAFWFIKYLPYQKKILQFNR